jgi:hypothetical protein
MHATAIRSRALATIAGAIVTSIATIAAAQAPSPPAATTEPSASLAGWDTDLYLGNSERARQAAALDQASRASIGQAMDWADVMTRASGSILPLRDYPGFGGARCRDYRVTVALPARNVMVWTTRFNTYNNSAVAREMPVPISPAFTRSFVAQACNAPTRLLASAARR